jgi:eukaryotic-like serine/threonine-protein kinase
MSSNLLRDLAKVAREQAASPEHERWERLAQGTLSHSEELELRRLSGSDPESARVYAAYVPLDDEIRARIAAKLADTVRTENRRAGNHSDRGETVLAVANHVGDRDKHRRSELSVMKMGEGEVLAGKYRIINVIGAGGMGRVFLAHHLLLDKEVAIKLFRPGADAVGRFVRELRATARIRSEHAVRVLDGGVLDDGAAYLVMERLEGCDLAAWLNTYGPLPLEKAVDFVLQACDAIAEAHELGIIHRDIKPANLFAVQSGAVETIKVLDFGLCIGTMPLSPTTDGADAQSGEAITEDIVYGDPLFIGSPFYMSPEQLEGENVDRLSDIWALGITLCELVTGRPPFSGTSLLQVYSRMVASARPSLRKSSPHVPEDLEAVILKCLERDRGKRYGSVAELATALVPFASSHAASHVAPSERPSSGSRGAPVASPAPTGRRAAGWERARSMSIVGRRGLVLASSLVVFALLALVARVTDRKTQEPVAVRVDGAVVSISDLLAREEPAGPDAPWVAQFANDIHVLAPLRSLLHAGWVPVARRAVRLRSHHALLLQYALADTGDASSELIPHAIGAVNVAVGRGDVPGGDYSSGTHHASGAAVLEVLAYDTQQFEVDTAMLSPQRAGPSTVRAGRAGGRSVAATQCGTIGYVLLSQASEDEATRLAAILCDSHEEQAVTPF